jgi:RNA polymerase sigma-70 factor (ECF subfamily)
MKVVHVDDVALFQAINSRDGHMVNRFYKRVYPKLFLAASKYLEDDHDASDAVTDVFLKFLQKEESFKNLEHIERTLILRVYWASKDKLKSIRRRGKQGITTDLLDEISATEDSIEEVIVKVELSNEIHEMIKALPPRYRVAIEQIFFEGKQNAEIARLLNTNSNALYIIKNRAIKRLQAIFTDNNIIIILLLLFPPE